MTDSNVTDAPTDSTRGPRDAKWFRQVLGQYPTGVCVVTAAPPGGPPAGMAVGSFTSVSLDPPMVAFLPDAKSSSWPRIRSAGRFCVNILAADQEPVCRRFAAKVEDKFAGLPYRLSALGSPIIEGVVAWIDCRIAEAREAGDHHIVLGAVEDLQIESGSLPLLFFQGGYGQFSPLSLAASDPLGTLTEQLRLVDVVRPEVERLAADLAARCMITARVDDELVIAAQAGSAKKGSASATLVGQRVPFLAPTGAVHAAWNGEAEIEMWLRETSALAARREYLSTLVRVRHRGYSLGLLSDAQRAFAETLGRLASARVSPGDADLKSVVERLSCDPPELTADALSRVRTISAPIFGPKGDVVLALTLYDFPRPPEDIGVHHYIHRLLDTTARATRSVGGIVRWEEF